MRRGKVCGSVELSGVPEDQGDTFVVDERDDAGGQGEGVPECSVVGVGWGWTESCCAGGAKESELDEGPSGQGQQRRKAGGRPVWVEVLSGESTHNASKALMVCYERHL